MTFGSLRHGLSATVALMLAAGLASAASITVQSVALAPTADPDLDNDFTRVQNALTQAVDNDTITFEGEFNFGSGADLAGTPKGEAWADYAAAGYYLDFAAAHSGVTLTSTGGATIKMDPMTPDLNPDPYPYPSGLYWGYNMTNLTIENIRWENFDYALGSYNVIIDDLTIQNCTIVGAPYSSRGGTLYIPLYLYPGSKSRNNVSIINNTFEFVANAATLMNPSSYSDYPQVRMIYLHTSTYPNLSISGNTFQATVDPAMPYSTEGTFKLTSVCWALFENMNSSNYTWNFAIDNNTFDGGVTLGSSTFRAFYTGQIISSPKRNLPAVGTRDGNTYRNTLFAIDNTWVWNATNPNHDLEIGDTTFENCGWSLAPLPDADFQQFWGTTSPGLVAIRNLRYGTYGGPGAKKVSFKFPVEVDGATDRDALHLMSDLRTFFEAVDDGNGGAVDGGILAAKVIDPPVVPVQDSKYNGMLWFSQPPFAGEENEVIGYTVIGDPVVPADPNLLANTTNPDDVIMIPAGTVYEVAPGSVIPHNLTFMTDFPKAQGAPTNAGVIVPTDNSGILLGQPLFKVAAGVTLTFDNVVISGNNPDPLFPGISEIIDGITFTGAGNLVVTNCTLTNFLGQAVNMTNAAGATITDSVIQDSGRGIYTGNNAALTVDHSIFTGVGTAIWSNRGNNIFTRNTFMEDIGSTMFSNSPADNMTLGGAGNGNLWLRNNTMSFNGRVNPLVSLVFEGNWHKNAYGDDIDTDGLIEGNVDVFQNGIQPDITAGVRAYEPSPGTAPTEPGPMYEVDLIARFDRDLDALPEAWEIGGATGFNVFDSDNDGWPDGVEAAQGTDPDNNGDFPAGVFDINADVDANGIADWYEDSLLELTGITPFLGDILRDDGQAGLQDAVRALQIVNGAFGTKDLSDGDLNALDVTGLGNSSLGNPLQILRYQAGVRQKLPALAGID